MHLIGWLAVRPILFRIVAGAVIVAGVAGWLATRWLGAAGDDPAEHAVLPGVAALDPITVGSLSVVPLVRTASIDDEPILVLDEAMERGVVAIDEVDGGSVATLRLVNRSDRPLFVLAGEVVVGGKQDRVIAANTVIPPATSQDVPVHCVEHGRWDNSSTGFTTAKALAHNDLRSAAAYDHQAATWAEVDKANLRHATGNATQTYRLIAEQQTTGAFAGWETAIARRLHAIPPRVRSRMIGYVVAINGRVVAIDLFQSSELFAKLSTKLVRSYITQAIGVAVDPMARAVDVADVAIALADNTGSSSRATPVFETATSTTRNEKDATGGRSQVILKTRAGDKHLYSNYLGNDR